MLTFLRIILSFFVLFFFSLNSANATLGLAFVHGSNDHREDAAVEYWKKDFMNTMRNSLASPDLLYIVACDYSYLMWDEAVAGCTANQLLNFINEQQIDKLRIYTHSHGANVIRWILSNPTYDPRYLELSKHVDQVIAIAPSSGGTPLADETTSGNNKLIGGYLGWLLGYNNDAIKQQRVGDMAIYNREILLGSQGRPSLSLPFRVIVGTDVTASPKSKSSSCNGYSNNTALKLTKSYLDSCADGFLNCTSQTTAGQVWFYDYQKTKKGEPLNHNQSRHSCSGLDNILIADLMQ